MTAKWITVTKNCFGTKLYIFRKSFTLDSSADEFNVKVSADTRYRLYINGKEICHGPCAGGVFKKYYEETECADALTVGENIIEVKVLHNADSNQLITMFRRNKPALFFEGIRVEKSVAVIDAPEPPDSSRRIQEPLREGRFARVNMRENAECEVVHGKLLSI